MHWMDLPRGRLDRSSGQPGEPAGETDIRAQRWAPDGRARPPAELLDNLRLRLSQLAENHPSAPRRRPAQRDWGEPCDWGDPRDWSDPRDRDARADRNAPGDRDTPLDRLWRPEQEAWPGEGVAAGPHIGSSADQHAEADDAQAERFGGLAEAIRAASQLSDGFPASPGPGMFGEVSWPGSWGDTEPYRPWFIGGDPWSPWWAG